MNGYPTVRMKREPTSTLAQALDVRKRVFEPGSGYTVPFVRTFPLVTAWRRRREYCKNPKAVGQAV
jgi:hypothetical protein